VNPLRFGSAEAAARVAIVTGAGRGLGAAIAERLARERHVIVADIDASAGAASAAAIVDGGGRATFVHTDIADAGSLGALARAAASFGRTDALVNNAAIANSVGGKTYDAIDEADWDRLFRVNVKGTWLACKHLAPLLVAGGGGSIVNLASDTALWGATRLLHYVATKGAILAMTRSLARELGPQGVRVNAVAPGLIAGEATAGVPETRWNDYRTRRALDEDQTPDDVAGAVAFLVSGDARYITGHTLVVDGGMVM
jgi:NAD(P)-dependent dehydrogenase (short-subunit alcohol dehydrogenase family)